MTGCTTCDLGLDHCHAPILEHADGTFDCLEGCGGPRAVHDIVLFDEPPPPMSPSHPAVMAAAAGGGVLGRAA